MRTNAFNVAFSILAIKNPPRCRWTLVNNWRASLKRKGPIDQWRTYAHVYGYKKHCSFSFQSFYRVLHFVFMVSNFVAVSNNTSFNILHVDLINQVVNATIDTMTCKYLLQPLSRVHFLWSNSYVTFYEIRIYLESMKTPLWNLSFA